MSELKRVTLKRFLMVVEPGLLGAGIGGEAVLLAGMALRENILKIAAHLLQMDRVNSP
jgi:hypothetical protein